MAFNSFFYLLAFLPLTALAVRSARRALGPAAAQACTLLASLIFYGWAAWTSLPLLLGSIVINWGLARTMDLALAGSVLKRRILQLGLLLNVGFLCTFKYVNFFLSGFIALGVPQLGLPDWALPLGISFFTLNQIMYLVDCYEGLTPANGLFDHATFVSFYPYVVSGPLARARNIVQQFHAAEPSDDRRFEQISRGLYQFALGLFKKVVFADTFGRIADIGFGAGEGCSTLETWAFSVSYTLQIYFDFSGYSDMALGSARILGIDIPKNFDSPLRSRSVTEFWQRWHISLSSFITTYLYTPILRAFPRATLPVAGFATLVSMTIAGLWHGPSLNFVVFGAMHGLALLVNLCWKRTKRRLPFALAWALTFAFVNLSFIFFRSPTLAAALHMAWQLVPGPGGLGTAVLATTKGLGITALVPPVLVGALAAFFWRSSDELIRDFRPRYRSAWAAAAMLLISSLYLNSTMLKQFVYFNF